MPNADGTMIWSEYRKLRNRCVACGTQDAYTLAGRTLCFECNERNNARMRENYKKNAERKSREQKAKCEARREAGLCVRCGKPLGENPGQYRNCEKCRAKARAASRKSKKTKNSRDTAEQCGLCYKCFAPLDVPGKKMCSACLEQMRKTQEAGREALRKKGYCWNENW